MQVRGVGRPSPPARLHWSNAWATRGAPFFRTLRLDPEALGEVLMRGGLVVALLLLAASSAGAQAHDTSRYTFGGVAEQGTFVLDTQTGRVWRYDRVDDAWYLYDLEALVGKSAHGKHTEPPPSEPPATEPDDAAPPPGDN